MAVPNVNQITATLRMLTDRQLQQYAAMHKGNPYIFPMAIAESNARKQVRAATQAAQGMQPQPKVADQAIAQMTPQQLPEDVGIATLPTPNMTMAAEGGIMGYEGYDEGDSNYGQESVRMMADGGIARYQSGGSIFDQLDQQKASQLAQLNSQLAMIEPQLRAAATSGNQQSIQLYAQQAQAIRNQINAVREAAGNRIGVIEKINAQTQAPEAAPSPTAAAAPAAPTPAPKPTFSPAVSRSMLNQVEQPARTNAAVYGEPQKAKAVPPVDTIRKEPSDRIASGPSRAQPPTDDVEQMFEKAFKKADAKGNEFEKQLKELNAAKVKAKEENLSGLEAIQKQFDDIYKGRKDRLSTREGEISKMKDQNIGLAALLAGATMMGTRGSIGEAVSKGVGVASQQYIAGMDKINSAKEKLSDARDRLDELEAQRGELSARELHKARNEIKDVTNSGMEDLIKAAMTERNLNRTQAIEFVKAQIGVNTAREKIRSEEGIAAMRENRADARAKMPAADIQRIERIMADRKISFTEALEVDAKLRRPGVESQSLSRFNKDNEKEINELTALSRSKKPETMQDVANRKAALRAAAIAAGVDPNSIPLLSGQGGTSPTGQPVLDYTKI